MFFIIVSSIHLVIDTPLVEPNTRLDKALWIIDLVITVVFTLESLLKMIAFGLIKNGKESYFR